MRGGEGLLQNLSEFAYFSLQLQKWLYITFASGLEVVITYPLYWIYKIHEPHSLSFQLPFLKNDLALSIMKICLSSQISTREEDRDSLLIKKNKLGIRRTYYTKAAIRWAI